MYQEYSIHRRDVLAAMSVGLAGCAGVFDSDGDDEDPEPFSAGEWRMSGGDAGNTSAQGSGHLSEELGEEWTSDVSAYPWVSPLVRDDAVFVGNGDGLWTVDDESGGTRQLLRLGHLEFVTGTPLVDGDGLLVPVEKKREGSGFLYAVELDGTVAWDRAIPGGQPGAVAPTGDGAVVRTQRAVCHVGRDGDVRWEEDAPEFTGEGQFTDHHFSDRRPAVADGTAYVPHPDGVRARDLSSGEELWHAETPPVYTSPTFSDGTVYCTTHGDGLRAVDAASGDEDWSVDLLSPTVSPAVDGDTIYTTDSSDLVALSTADGEERWRFDDPALGGASYTDPVAVGEYVVAGSLGRTLTVVSSDGDRQATFDGHGALDSHAVANDAIYVIDAAGTLRKFTTTDDA